MIATALEIGPNLLQALGYVIAGIVAIAVAFFILSRT